MKKINADLFQNLLLDWFDQFGRKNLPWQHDINAYRVWVSEIMLQQTQVATVIPYYERFMQVFPDVRTLADAHLDRVLHLWTGLGYYTRARNLHKTAQTVANDFEGEFPNTLDDMVSLPGIGRSTAGAILAIAQQRRHAILDGNVKRVLTRIHAVKGWPGERHVSDQLWALAEHYTPHERVADFTQAMMDLGATLCTRSKPQCNLCPMAQHCSAYAQGTPTAFPHKKPKKVNPIKSTVFLIIQNNRNEVLLARRPAKGIWGGLYCFVQSESVDCVHAHVTKELALTILTMREATAFRHTFSHYHLDIQPVFIEVIGSLKQGLENDGYFWYKLGQINECGLAAPVKKLIQQLEREQMSEEPS